MGKKVFSITPQQVKDLIAWDEYEQGNCDISVDDYEVSFGYLRNKITATWKDSNEAGLEHTKTFDFYSIFGSEDFAYYAEIDGNEFFEKVAATINEYFNAHLDSVLYLPF